MTHADPDRVALEFIAEGIAELAGFGAAAISVVRDDTLVTLAVAAADEPSAAALMELRAPVSAVLAELEPAESWGLFQFLPAERSPGRLEGYGWVPEIEPSTDADAWHPEDLLCALLHDDEGELRGVLSIDLPRNGRRPDAEQRRILELFARQAARAVISVLERERYRTELAQERELASYRRQLLETMAHQLQNPATAILTNLELAEELVPTGADDGGQGVELQQSVAAARRGAERISSMSAELLTMARVDDPDRPQPTQRLDLAEIVTTATGLVTASNAYRRVRVEVAGPAWVIGDRGDLEALVENLVDNAVKYSEDEVVVSLVVEGPDVVLSVEDHGVGIAAADQDRLFEPFFRSADPAARRRRGSGLGLAIVARVASRHDGRVAVDSLPGVGTTFRVVLPAAP